MNRYAYGYPRRRSTSRQHLVCIVLAVAGVAIGIGGSVLWPWGFAPAPHALEPQLPAPGVLMMSADMIDAATVPEASVRHFGPPAQASGTAVFIRGARHGNKRVYVDCTGALLMIEGDKPASWQPSGGNISDMIGQALCAGHPLLRELPALRT